MRRVGAKNATSGRGTLDTSRTWLGSLKERDNKCTRSLSQGILKGGKYHCTIDLLFDWFGLACLANTNKNYQLSYSWLIPNQSNRRWTVQWYLPFSIPWVYPRNTNLRGRPSTFDLLALTNLHELLLKLTTLLTFSKTSYLYEEVNLNEPSPSFSVPSGQCYKTFYCRTLRFFIIRPEPTRVNHLSGAPL